MMESGIPGDGDLRRSAAVLETHSEEIVAAYERRLLEADSPLVTNAARREQLKVQARSVLEDVVRNLRGQRPSSGTGGEGDTLSAGIGASRAREGVHASESLRAVTALSEAALSVVVEELSQSGPSTGEVAKVALAIQESIMERAARASVSYVGYLLRKVHESHADERRRIGRELHDRVAHSIMVAFRNLELYEVYRAREDDSRARTKLQNAKRNAQEALQFARGLSSELRNCSAEEGLEVALSNYLHLVVPAGVEARISLVGDESLLAPEIRDELFLIVREAIRNAVAHAGARRIDVQVSVSRDLVRAAVEDDGRGFDPENVSAVGMGLSSMGERASLLGGTLDAASLPEGGARVEVCVPLPRSLP